MLNIETIINDKAISLFLEKPNWILFNKKRVEFLNNISRIVISTEYVIVFEMVDLWNFTEIKNTRSNDNINFFDWDGNFLFNITNIISDSGFSYTAGNLLDINQQKKYPIVFMNEHEYFQCVREDNMTFIIDLTDKKIIYKNCNKN